MIRFSLLISFLLFFGKTAWASPSDSLRIEKSGDKSFIIHKVDDKETLYGLSRRYNVPINQILENNPDAKSGLEVGTILRIPYIPRSAEENGEIHIVKPSETLFFISRQYNVSVDDLKKWNNLTSNELNVGQKLIVKQGAMVVIPQVSAGDSIFHVVKPSETLYSISRDYNLQVVELRNWNRLPDNTISIGQKLFVGMKTKAENTEEKVESPTPVVAVQEKAEESKEKEVSPVNQNANAEEKKEEVVYVGKKKDQETITNSSGYTRVVQNGLAAMIDGTDDNKKYLALHRTAKIGTIMQVRNEMNNKVVFVRILGRLPDTGANDGILIRLSKAAYDRLGALDKKFRVEISYVP